MLKQIDRLMVLGYFKAYFVCLLSLLSLYIVVDLFTNLDDFIPQNQTGLGPVLNRIVGYYGYRIPQFFDRLCEAIVLLAAMFTVAMMQRNNEQIPLLSAGVSTQRIVLPVILCAFFMLALSIVNQELVIPRIGDKLVLDRKDPAGEKEIPVWSAYEPSGLHIEGDRASRNNRSIRGFRCTIPETIAGSLIHITAKEAQFHNGHDSHRHRWELSGCTPRDIEPIPDLLEVRDNGRYRLFTRTVDFEAVTRNPKWHLLASTHRLYTELQRPESNRLAAVAVLFHTRLTRMLLGMVLVLLGLSVILRDQNRNVIVSSGMCLVLCGLFYVCCYGCKLMGDNEVLNPALSAWLPILLFGPFAVVLFDAVQT